MTFLRQVWTLFLTHLRLWLRIPRHPLISILLSVLFLLIADHLFVVWLGKHMAIGLHIKNDRVARTVANQFHDAGMTAVRYDSLVTGCYDLVRGSIVGLVSIHTSDVQRIDLLFSGRNPLLDRELAGVLLNVAMQTSESVDGSMNINLYNNTYSTSVMSVFMAAGTLPFLILILASINCGLSWRQDWEYNTLYFYLVTPIRRSALVLGRLLGGMVLTACILFTSMLVCQPFLSWTLPDNLYAWVGCLLLLIFFSCSFFFVIAVLTRGTRLYDDITYMAVLLLMFISGVIVPIETMPVWEQFVARFVPTFYGIRLLRSIMTDFVPFLVKDVFILAAWGIACCVIGYIILTWNSLERR
jgi:ABC-type multidrug transport system permease subunit